MPLEKWCVVFLVYEMPLEKGRVSVSIVYETRQCRVSGMLCFVDRILVYYYLISSSYVCTKLITSIDMEEGSTTSTNHVLYSHLLQLWFELTFNRFWWAFNLSGFISLNWCEAFAKFHDSDDIIGQRKTRESID